MKTQSVSRSFGYAKFMRTLLTGVLAIGLSAVVLPQAHAVDGIISSPDIVGVAIPVQGATPTSSISATDSCTATITLVAKAGYTLTGVTANFFTVSGAVATNSADGGVITAVFPATAAATDARLSGLYIMSVTSSPVFDSETVSYTASVATGVSSIAVYATLNDTNGSLTINGSTVASSVSSGSLPLTVGANTITIVATAQDGTTTKTYTITVARASAPIDTTPPARIVLPTAEEIAAADAATKLAAEKAAAKVEADRLAALKAAAIIASGNTIRVGTTYKSGTKISLDLADAYYGKIAYVYLGTTKHGITRYVLLDHFAMAIEDATASFLTKVKLAKGQVIRVSIGKVAVKNLTIK